ncbi:MAG: hypothetical protein WD231_00705 [Candidatus Woykebacteria bacterium]
MLAYVNVPKKTKKEKILARLHRLQQKTNEASFSTPLEVSDQKKIKLEESSPEQTPTPKESPKPSSKQSLYDYTYVYKDLRKIFILSLFGFAIEIVLSLTASNGYAKLVLRTLNLDF